MTRARLLRRGAIVIVVVGALAVGSVVTGRPRTIWGDDGEGIVQAIESDPAVRLAPPGAKRAAEFASVDSGTATVLRSYRYPGSRAAFEGFYRERLPALGWSSSPTKLQGDGGLRFVKDVDGREWFYDVEHNPPGGSAFQVTAWTDFDTGLLGG